MIDSPGGYRSGCVVVVAEDEFPIRMVAAAALTEAGFVVIEAVHAADAINILRAQASGVGLLFTDIQMPGTMNGLELAHQTKSNWLWIKLLIVSVKARPAADDMPAGSRFLAKPYNLDHAVAHIRELTAA